MAHHKYGAKHKPNTYFEIKTGFAQFKAQVCRKR